MGKPAARVGDAHTCPQVNPGPAAIPHVGMPIAGPGVPTVLIGGQPAAVQGDMCPCIGPPDTIATGSSGVFIGGKPAARMGDMSAHGGQIAMGCPTVLIGESGGGGGGGGGGGSAKAFEITEQEATKYWVTITLTDSLGDPIADEQYKILLRDGTVLEAATLDDQGFAKIDDVKEEFVMVEFPNLDRSEWLAKGAIEVRNPKPTKTKTHKVKPNEYLGSIAKQYGFSHWKAIYQHPANEHLRKLRPNPNILMEGDEIAIPQKNTKQAVVRSRREQKFELLGAATNRLKLSIYNEKGDPMTNRSFQIEFGETIITGTTDNSGRINTTIPPDAPEKAILTIQNNEEEEKSQNQQVYWIDIGGVNPMEEITGIQTRLKILGYYHGKIDGEPGEKTEEAILQFQRDQEGLKIDGDPGPITQEKLDECYQSNF